MRKFNIHIHSNRQQMSTMYAILAAILYAISSPVSKTLLKEIPATLMASLLYLGAGLGMLLLGLFNKDLGLNQQHSSFQRKDIIFIISMIMLDIAAPILLMFGLQTTTSANVSLLNNFEIVTTSLIAMILFKEFISKKLWIAIVFITLASILLSFEDASSFSFSSGSLLVILACICWGFENNCTRILSVKNPYKIVVMKGFGAGIVSFLIALFLHQRADNIIYIISALILGFVAYGLSIFFYICAQRDLGAAKTSAFYALAPFFGVGFSLIIYRQIPDATFILALFIMIIGTYFASKDVN